jgi:hypothetical protein
MQVRARKVRGLDLHLQRLDTATREHYLFGHLLIANCTIRECAVQCMKPWIPCNRRSPVSIGTGLHVCVSYSVISGAEVTVAARTVTTKDEASVKTSTPS